MQKKDCTGCFACFNICPTNCISMQADEEGFLYPVVDNSICTNCHMCEKTCPVQKKERIQQKIRETYAAYNIDNAKRQCSSSGGIFTAIAETIIAKGGVVFGAGFDDKYEVHHMLIEDESELCKLRGSKYVQSRIADLFRIAKEFITKGKLVLFVGTPCQIAGLKSFLGKHQYNNLITIDFICHGVPSPTIWKKYLDDVIAEHSNQKICNINFRNKKYGWKKYCVSFEFDSGETELILFKQNTYMHDFINNLSLRPSCYNCYFKGPNRSSDITLGDFWGIEKIDPQMDDDKGTSLVFINTMLGLDIFNKISTQIIYKEVDYKLATKYNISANRSSRRPILRQKYFRDTLKKHM